MAGVRANLSGAWRSGLLLVALSLSATQAPAQQPAPSQRPAAAAPRAPAALPHLATPMATPMSPALATPQPAATNELHLSAVYGSENLPVNGGLHWRVFNERAEDDGSHAMVAQSTDAAPTLLLADGDYIVHAAFGLAGETRRVVLAGRPETARLNLNAGALRVGGVIGSTPIPANRLLISLFVPEHGNAEAKLVVDNASAGEVILLPEGNYHVVSTYLDTVGIGSVQSGPQSSQSARASNSLVTADIRVQTGKLMDVTLRHRAAVVTLKLVNGPNGEALTDTQFTVLTPGGDVIRELIGAFPSLILAEGEYVAIARHAGTTFQANFKVQSGLDRDIEIIGQ